MGTAGVTLVVLACYVLYAVRCNYCEAIGCTTMNLMPHRCLSTPWSACKEPSFDVVEQVTLQHK